MNTTDIFLEDLLFVAENEETGKRIEFSVFELIGDDDDGININGECYSLKAFVGEPWIIAGFCTDKIMNERYIFRLKRKDEDEEGLIMPLRISAVYPLKEGRLSITFSNNEQAIFGNFYAQHYGKTGEFTNFTFTERYIEWTYGIKIGVLDLIKWFLIEE